jgi:hypothetical protein
MQASSLRLTLQLLPVPTKAVVAAAFADLGVDLLTNPGPSLCFVPRIAYDDNIFKVSMLLPTQLSHVTTPALTFLSPTRQSCAAGWRTNTKAWQTCQGE